MTYQDYLKWPEYPRYELIDGMPHQLTSPSVIHHEVRNEILFQLYKFAKGKPFRVLMSPLDVRLNYGNADNTVVQPDILAADRNKFDELSCKGAPDLIIEILEPVTTVMDKEIKFDLYQRAGVREYWIVDPEKKNVQTFILKDEAYDLSYNGGEGKIPVHVLPGCEIDLTDVFPPDMKLMEVCTC